MHKPCLPKNILPSTLILVGATTMILGSINLIPAEKYALAQGTNTNFLIVDNAKYETVTETQALQSDENIETNKIEDYNIQQYIVGNQNFTYSDQLLPSLDLDTLFPVEQETIEDQIVSTSTVAETSSMPENNIYANDVEKSEVQESSPREGYVSPLANIDTPLFPVSDEQRQLIEIASNMKDTSPFNSSMGPNTHNRYQEWMNADRSIKNPNSVRAYAFLQMGRYGWNVEEWMALDRLWWHESGWAPTRRDGDTNRAWGIPQALPASKMAKYGEDYLTNPYVQVLWGLDYINSRYGSPTKAWNFWLEKAKNGNSGWY
jgi:hypothetical protein